MSKKQNRIQVEIEKATCKAVLISAAGRQGWIQKRWMDEETQTVSERVFEKACSNYEAEQAERQAMQAWRDAHHPVRVDRETEKAIATEITIYFGSDDFSRKVMLWFPKSMCENGNEVPGWMIDSKVKDAKRSFDPGMCAFFEPEDIDRLYS